MTPHTHTTLVKGCYRCDLNLDEIQPWSCVECDTETGPSHPVDVDLCVPCFERVATEAGYIKGDDGVWRHPEGTVEW